MVVSKVVTQMVVQITYLLFKTQFILFFIQSNHYYLT